MDPGAAGASMMPTPSPVRTPSAEALAGDQIRIGRHLADDLGGVQHLDHARPVVASGALLDRRRR